MTDPSPNPEFFLSRPLRWSLILVALVIFGVGLALQIGALRSQSEDVIHVDRARPPGTTRRGMGRPPSPTPRGDEHLPAYGEYVYVEESPGALTKVAPEYPDAAREANIEGTVVVQALIGRDGLVKETKVVNSVPELDASAVAAVEQWTFTPAKNKGEPVAVWVAIPVQFTLR